MKKRFLAALATGLFLVGMGGEAQALIIDYTKFTLTSPDDALILYGNESSQSLITKAINDFFTPDLIELYKADYNPPLVESGDLSGSYDIVFSNTVNDPRNATITYIQGDIVGPTAYALVKDGNATPNWFLFNLTSLKWNGTEKLEFQNFYPNGGAISHVTLYGNRAPVPEPGTVLLFGTGLAGLAAVGRRRKS